MTSTTTIRRREDQAELVIRLPVTVRDALRAAAARNGMTLNAYARTLLHLHHDRLSRTPEVAS